MKLFSVLKNKKSGDSCANSTTSGKSSRDGSASYHKTTARKKGDKSKETKLTKDSSKYVKAAHKWMEAMNTYVPDDPQAFTDRINACYESIDSPVILEDGEAYRAEDCSKLFVLTHRSFPDFVMNYGEVVELKTSDKHNYVEVEVTTVFATGTHTGTPYTIIPGVLPEIPPSGKPVENDEQTFVLTLDKKTAKIIKCQVIAMGTHTGFAGFYTRAGGDVEPLLAAKKAAAAAAADAE